MSHPAVYLNHLGVVNALGADRSAVMANLISGDASGMQPLQSQYFDKTFIAGRVGCELPAVPSSLARFNCRNNQLLLKAIEQIQSAIEELKTKLPAHKIGIVLGTSTSGIEEFEKAMAFHREHQELPKSFDYKQQEIGSVAEFLSAYLQITGPAYTVSTACSSSGKVFASARALIEQGLCDAVITGGVDSLCEMTLNGFDSLEAISNKLTNPFSANRDGINIGEGAAVFIMSKEPSSVCLLGVGESSDAHHISAPHPEGKGAIAAIEAALDDAKLKPADIDYLNLHGTGTPLNDSMESKAVHSVFADQLPCSSTKPLIGHTLGAAGANEAAFAWLLLADNSNNKLPPHKFDGECDPELANIQLVKANQSAQRLNTIMSNSFAFGGNNVSVILGKSSAHHFLVDHSTAEES